MSTTQPPPSGAFSTAGEDAITRTIEINDSELTSAQIQDADLDDLFEIVETAQAIKEGDYKQIALQFPDELLGVSVPIYKRLKELLGEGRNAYVLADTTYGSCCVDEVAAAHIDADVAVHYGHACLSPTSRLPVIYVFGKKPIDVDDSVAQFAHIVEQQLASDSLKKFVLVKTDVSYAYITDRFQAALQAKIPSVEVVAPSIHKRYIPPPDATRSAPRAPADPNQPSELPLSPALTFIQSPRIDRIVKQLDEHSVEESIILCIGGESLALTNFLLTHAQSEVISYDPQTKSTRRETGRVNKLLMRRYAIIQKARDADVFGILVGTLGVASYIPLMTHLRQILSKAQKKCYTISVGKLNPAKLANFMEIECFVLVACPENSVIESKEFYRPIITPFELEVALGADRSWTGEYILNFDQILAGKKEDPGEAEQEVGSDEEQDSDRPAFSLVTGTYRHAKRYGDPRAEAPTDTSGSAIALRNNEGALSQIVANAASDFLQARSFQGLEQRLGQDAPAVLEQGRSGIAKGYADVDHSSELQPSQSGTDN
ncbi:diphthamide biosynthesis protein [Ceratobasidium sp. AG-I]|nr:diphthamide biosynthesis protein [Ceratobasidium sp. AG-I]